MSDPNRLKATVVLPKDLDITNDPKGTIKRMWQQAVSYERSSGIPSSAASAFGIPKPEVYIGDIDTQSASTESVNIQCHGIPTLSPLQQWCRDNGYDVVHDVEAALVDILQGKNGPTIKALVDKRLAKRIPCK